MPPGPVGVVCNRTVSAQLETVPTIQGKRGQPQGLSLRNQSNVGADLVPAQNGQPQGLSLQKAINDMAKKRRDTKSNENGATLGFEAKLYQAADKLRNNLDAAEYKHVVLGLIFLKYISDAFEEKRDWLLRESANPHSELYIADETLRYQIAEDRDEYTADNVFYVPEKARWTYLQANAKQPEIGTLVDDAMIAIEGKTRV